MHSEREKRSCASVKTIFIFKPEKATDLMHKVNKKEKKGSCLKMMLNNVPAAKC
jgi:hypothetical protein